MLSKLLKHEFMVTWKIPVLLDAVLIGLGLMSYVALRAVPHMEDSIGVLVLLFALIGIFYIGLIAASIILQIYLVLRYYRNLYTEEGYLTFTLPVSPDHILNAKLINGYIWELLSLICTLASLFIAAAGMLQAMAVNSAELQEFADEMMSIFGVDDPHFIISILLMGIISPLASTMSLYFCVTVGQLWQKHKILGAILCYIGIYVANQIMAQVAIFSSAGFFEFMDEEFSEGFDPGLGSLYAGMFTKITVFQLILSVAFYIACILINRKKVNLD